MIARFIGILGGLGTTISFSPQLQLLFYRTHTKSDIEHISLPMFFIHLFGVINWVVYGFLVRDWIIVGFNMFTTLVVLICILRICYLRYFTEN